MMVKKLGKGSVGSIWHAVAASFVAICAVFGSSPVFAGDKEEAVKILMDDEPGRIAVYSAGLAALRDEAIRNPSAAISAFFGQNAQTAWTSDISHEMIDEQISDFFLGSIALDGPQDRNNAVAALYNPWWDAILVARLCLLSTPDAEPKILVESFYFLSGETFRGENPDEISTRTIVPENDPVSVELWRVASATRARFERLFPLERNKSPRSWGALAGALRGLDKAREMERIQVRSALRMKFTMMLLKNPTDTGIAAYIARLVRSANYYRLCNYFRAKQTRPLLKTLSEMPALFRKDFIPYGYVPTASGTLYLLVNKNVPRLYATVNLPRDTKTNPASLEWYDLSQSEELLSAWNSRKEAAK